MAVTIISQGQMCDGYDVRVDADGQHEVVHFQSQPSDVDAAIAAWYASRPEPVQYMVIGE